MQSYIQITFRGLPRSEAVEAKIREKIEWLERFYGRLMHCHVVVETPHQHSRQGKLYHVTLELTIPDAAPVVIGRAHHDKHEHEDVYVAIRDTFAAARRHLQERARKLRGEVKLHEVPLHGRVARKPGEDYGFIETPDGLNVYFHANSLIEGDFETLPIDSEVRFAMHEGEGVEGPQASTVHVVGKHHLQAR